MSPKQFKKGLSLLPAILGCLLVLGWMAGYAIAEEPAGHEGHQQASPKDSPSEEAPHGGQISTEKPYIFEVVYQPKEIRVYAYTQLPNPIAMNEVKGEITFKDIKTSKTSKISLKHVKPAQGSSVEEYLSAEVDSSKDKDGEKTLSIQLEGLPQSEHVKAAFTQTFALTKAKQKVKITMVESGEADKAAIAKQKTCPVTGAKLGSMGDPLKVMIGEESLYICCEGCLGKVKKSPEEYLAKAKKSSSNP